jgi:uncharacterized protein
MRLRGAVTTTIGSALAAVMAMWLIAMPVRAQETPENVALLLARQLAEGRFSEIEPRFTPEMAGALPAAKLAQIWAQLTAQAGPLRAIGQPRAAQRGSAALVTVPLRFEKGAFDLAVTVSGERIAGLWIRAAETVPGAWTSAPYDNPAAYRALEVTVGSAPTALAGTLLLPRATGKVAAVVLVHGSGAHDRNEAIGPIRPFEDLAEGLASRGIAVLRYDKRSKVYPESFAGRAFTVREEVIDDALAAVSLLRARPEIDPAKIVVLGHSLGAMLAPRIAQEDASIAAIVMLAAAARPIPDLIVEQTEYLAGLPGARADASATARLAAIKEEAAAARAAKPGLAGPLILNAPPSYWADLNAYDPVTTAAALTLPILVLQGGRDYQTTATDFARFSAALAGRTNVTLTLLPRLNHLFIAGTGRSTPAEYQQPGHIDGEAIEAISRFIYRALGA